MKKWKLNMGVLPEEQVAVSEEVPSKLFSKAGKTVPFSLFLATSVVAIVATTFSVFLFVSSSVFKFDQTPSPTPKSLNHVDLETVDPNNELAKYDLAANLPDGYTAETFPEDIYGRARLVIYQKSGYLEANKYGVPLPGEAYIKVRRYETETTERPVSYEEYYTYELSLSKSAALPKVPGYTKELVKDVSDQFTFSTDIQQITDLACNLIENCVMYATLGRNMVNAKENNSYVYEITVVSPSATEEISSFETVATSILNSFTLK